MYTTGEAVLFFCVFASQVLLISWLYPRRVVGRTAQMLKNYPPTTHPKLYVKPIEYYERGLRTYARLNQALVVAGLLIIVALSVGMLGGDWSGAIVTPWSTSGEWDAAIVVPFFLVQWIAALYYAVAMLKHQKAMAKAAPPRVRTTELKRRRLVDFVSPAVLATAVALNAALIVFVLWYRRFDFPWFTATGNIVGVVMLLAAMAAAIGSTLYARKPDHYQAHRDRLEFMKLVVNQVVAFSIVYPLLLATQLTIKIYDPDFLEPVITSLGVQLISLAWLWPSYRYRVDKVDFDVYKSDSQESTGPSAPQPSR